METTITLTWSPLCRLKDFRPDEIKSVRRPCVYLWGFLHRGFFIPYYVGRTRRPFERAMQHYSNLRGGLYPIYHRSSLSAFYHYKNAHKKTDASRRFKPCNAYGMLYTPASPHAQGELFTHPNVQSETEYMADTFRFAYASLDTPDVTGIAERALADRIGRDFLQSTVAESASKSYGGGCLRLRHTSELEPCSLVIALNALEAIPPEQRAAGSMGWRGVPMRLPSGTKGRGVVPAGPLWHVILKSPL